MRTEDAISSLKFIKSSFAGDCTTNTLVPISRVDVEALSMAIKSLENQKTGHWKKISPAGIMECSVCGGNVLTSDIEAYKYCHHCGAKMEGE